MNCYEEFMDRCSNVEGFVIACFTDKFLVDTWPLNCSINRDKLLEMRVFNSNAEYKLFRSDISKTFKIRIIDAEMEKKDEYKECFEEWQYLDVDESRLGDFKDKHLVFTTGGGKYQLPMKSTKNAGVKIKYYFGMYAETGQARIDDWRLVEFGEVPENEL